jgi:tetratricopeptide (TPR) repeat protein
VAQHEELQGLLRQGIAAHQQGKLDEARACYERILETDPSQIDAMHLLGVLSGQQNNFEEALRLLASVANRAPNAPLVLLNYGNALLHVGRGTDAIASYDKAIAIQPNYVDAWVNKGNALLAAGQHADAAASYEKALAINPQLFPVWSNRARALTELKRFEDALESYQRALSLNANHAETWANKGGLLEHLRRRDEALACYDRAVAINPQLFAIWFARGRIFHELERYDEAMACYQKTIALKPDHVGALHAAGNLYSSQGDTAQAAAVLDRVLSLTPDWLSARFARCTAELPAVYETESQTDRHRSVYQSQLNDLASRPRHHSSWPTKVATIANSNICTVQRSAGSCPSTLRTRASSQTLQVPANGCGWVSSAVTFALIRTGKFRSTDGPLSWIGSGLSSSAITQGQGKTAKQNWRAPYSAGSFKDRCHWQPGGTRSLAMLRTY